MAASSSSVTSGDNGPPNGGNGNPPPPTHGEWASSMQAYYVSVSVSAAAAGHHHPYAAWPPPPPPQQQGLMAPGPAYGVPVPVPFPMYHHPAYYAHAPMAAGAPYMVGEAASAVTAEGNRKRKTTRVPSGDDASDDAGSQGSSAKTVAGAEHDQKGSSSAKRRKSPSAANTEGEPSQAATMHNAVTEAPLMDKGRSASKPSVSAPGRVALTNATPNLNIGMDPLNTSSSAVMPSGQGEVNAGASSQSNGSLSQMDERELKRERRKQANRDSARRSRLRKQQECEELAQKVTELTAINGVLKAEIDQLKKDCEDMEAENTQLMDEILTGDDDMLESEDPSDLTTLSIQVDVSMARHGRNRRLHKSTNDVSKG